MTTSRTTTTRMTTTKMTSSKATTTSNFNAVFAQKSHYNSPLISKNPRIPRLCEKFDEIESWDCNSKIYTGGKTVCVFHCPERSIWRECLCDNNSCFWSNMDENFICEKKNLNENTNSGEILEISGLRPRLKSALEVKLEPVRKRTIDGEVFVRAFDIMQEFQRFLFERGLFNSDDLWFLCFSLHFYIFFLNKLNFLTSSFMKENLLAILYHL